MGKFLVNCAIDQYRNIMFHRGSGTRWSRISVQISHCCRMAEESITTHNYTVYIHRDILVSYIHSPFDGCAQLILNVEGERELRIEN